MKLRTLEECSSLPEVKMFDNEYRFFGSQGVHGDDICAFVDERGMWRVECRRKEPDGPDIWVKTLVGF